MTKQISLFATANSPYCLAQDATGIYWLESFNRPMKRAKL